jgi:hypothetical protein
MSIEHWDSRGFALNSRAMFNSFLQEFIAMSVNSYNECSTKIIIGFPNVLTKSDRYAIHKFTIRGDFEPVTHETQYGRIMEVTLSQKFAMELMKDYPFEVTPVQEPVPKTDKQILFDSMMNFIHQNLENEFIEYMNTI